MTDHTGVETPDPEDADGEEQPTAYFTIDGPDGKPRDISHLIKNSRSVPPFGQFIPVLRDSDAELVRAAAAEVLRAKPEPDQFDMDVPSEVMHGAKIIKDMSFEELLDEATHHQNHFFKMMATERLRMVVANGRLSRYKERLCHEMGMEGGFDVTWHGDD